MRIEAPCVVSLTWRLRDAVDYMETASLSVLEFASKYKDSLLFDRYQAGRDQSALGKTKAPYAYVIPQQQRDPVAAVEMLRRIAFGGVDRARQRFDLGLVASDEDRIRHDAPAVRE